MKNIVKNRNKNKINTYKKNKMNVKENGDKMNKKSWTFRTLVVVATCVMAGTVLSMFIFYSRERYSYAYVNVNYSNRLSIGAGEMPNGKTYRPMWTLKREVYELAKDKNEILRDYTYDEVKENFIYASGDFAKTQGEVMNNDSDLITRRFGQKYTPEKSTFYLRNKFNKQMTASELEGALQAISEAYIEDFYLQYGEVAGVVTSDESSINKSPKEKLNDLKNEFEKMNDCLARLSKDIKTRQIAAKTIQGITSKINYILNTTIPQLENYIQLDAASKSDSDIILYKYKIQELETSIANKQNEQAFAKERMDKYEENTTTYYIGKKTTIIERQDNREQYDAAVAEYTEISNEVSRLSVLLQEKKERLAALEKTNKKPADSITEEDTQKIETELLKLDKEKDSILHEVNNVVEEYNNIILPPDSVQITDPKTLHPNIFCLSFLLIELPVVAIMTLIGLISCIVCKKNSEKQKTEECEAVC